MSSNSAASQRKVRVACQRCRARRIKCDGQAPSCANCAKAGAACVDVDARNAQQLVPRDAATRARARIQWLENIISTNLPSVDLSDGPQVDSDFGINSSRSTFPHNPGMIKPHRDIAAFDPEPTQTRMSPIYNQGQPEKRPREVEYNEDNDQNESFNAGVQSVATDLGVLTLNSGSRDKHYMGSSSGLYFTHLVQAQSPQGESPKPQQPKSFQSSGNVRRVKHDYSPIYQALTTNLPPEDDALYLLDVYFRHVHPDHPVLHVGSVYDTLNSLHRCKSLGADASLDRGGWPADMTPFAYNGEMDLLQDQSCTPITIQTAVFHMFMIFTIAASVRLGERQTEFAPLQFYRVASTVASGVLEETSMSSLQSIYLMALHALMSPAKSNIWTLTHICIANSIDLGIHRQQTDLMPTTRITKALLFYSVYSLDRSVATIQGRPLGIRDETFDVELPSIDEVHQEVDSLNVPVELSALIKGTISYTLHRLKLDKTISEVKLLLYHLPARTTTVVWSMDHETQQDRLKSTLDEWYSHISPTVSHLQGSNAEIQRWQLQLELQYYAVLVILFQPSQVFRRPSNKQMVICFEAAVRQMSCYESLYQQDMLQLDWRVIRSIFACGATIIYCFWTSKAVQNSAMSFRVPLSLKSCSTLLAIGGVWWPSVKQGKASFDRLVEVTMQKVNKAPEEKEQQQRKKTRIQKRTGPAPSRSIEAPSLHQSQLHPHPSSFFADEDYGYTALPEEPLQDEALTRPNQDTYGRYEINAIDGMSKDQAHESSEYVQNRNEVVEVSPNYDFSQFENVPNFEPEIEAFFSEYFLDDNTWSTSDTGPPLAFHFGNL